MPATNRVHIVWDWNGTLFDDVTALIDSTTEAFARLGFPVVTPRRYRALHIQPIDLFYDRLAGRTVPPESRARLYAAFEAAYNRRLPRLRPFPETREVLEAVRSQGATQSLLSMHPHDRLCELVTRFGLRGHFTRVDGARQSLAHKEEHLRGHLAALRIAADTAIVVGDSVDDARAAARVGAGCVLFASGLHDRAALERQGVAVADELREAVRHALARCREDAG